LLNHKIEKKIYIIRLVNTSGRKSSILKPDEISNLAGINRKAHIRHQCRKTTVLGCHRCLTTALKKWTTFKYRLELSPPMSLSKCKCWYSNNCLHFLKRAALCQVAKQNMGIFKFKLSILLNVFPLFSQLVLHYAKILVKNRTGQQNLDLFCRRVNWPLNAEGFCVP